MKKKLLTNKSGHVRELKSDDIKAMRSAVEVLPEKLLDVLPIRKRGERGAQKEPKKILITLRFSPDVVNYFKGTGAGWQTRMDGVLRGYVKKHPTSSSSGQHKHSKRHKHTSRSIA